MNITDMDMVLLLGFFMSEDYGLVWIWEFGNVHNGQKYDGPGMKRSFSIWIIFDSALVVYPRLDISPASLLVFLSSVIFRFDCVFTDGGSSKINLCFLQ